MFSSSTELGISSLPPDSPQTIKAAGSGRDGSLALCVRGTHYENLNAES